MARKKLKEPKNGWESQKKLRSFKKTVGVRKQF